MVFNGTCKKKTVLLIKSGNFPNNLLAVACFNFFRLFLFFFPAIETTTTIKHSPLKYRWLYPYVALCCIIEDKNGRRHSQDVISNCFSTKAKPFQMWRYQCWGTQERIIIWIQMIKSLRPLWTGLTLDYLEHEAGLQRLLCAVFGGSKSSPGSGVGCVRPAIPQCRIGILTDFLQKRTQS